MFRNLNFKYIAERNISMTLLSSLGLKITLLISTYFGISGIIEGDYILIFVYLLSGTLGDLLSFKIKKT